MTEEMMDGTTSFVLCVEGLDYSASLEPRRIYQALSDPEAEQHGLLRVIDESGENYLYSTDFFVPIQVGAG